MSLSEPMEEEGQAPHASLPGAGGTQVLSGEQERPINHTTTNHFFHFDGKCAPALCICYQFTLLPTTIPSPDRPALFWAT